MKFLFSKAIAFLLFLFVILTCRFEGNQSNVNKSINKQSPSQSSSPESLNQSKEPRLFESKTACNLFVEEGFNLGEYIAFDSEYYGCMPKTITISCNPSSEFLCNTISYSTFGYKNGVSQAKLVYTATSLHEAITKKDLALFISYCEKLSVTLLGQELDKQIKQKLSETKNYLPMTVKDSKKIEEAHLIKQHGKGYIDILGRSNKNPGGMAYMLFFSVYSEKEFVGK